MGFSMQIYWNGLQFPPPGDQIQIWTFSSVQSLSHIQLFANQWTAAREASLSITNSHSLLKLVSIEWVMPTNHLILCRPLPLLPSVLPSIRVSLHHVTKVLELQFHHLSLQWVFRIDFLLDWLVWSCSLRATIHKHQFFSTQCLGLLDGPTLISIHD